MKRVVASLVSLSSFVNEVGSQKLAICKMIVRLAITAKVQPGGDKKGVLMVVEWVKRVVNCQDYYYIPYTVRYM